MFEPWRALTRDAEACGAHGGRESLDEINVEIAPQEVHAGTLHVREAEEPPASHALRHG